MSSPDHDESKPHRRWPTYLAMALIFLLVVYPLSIGPAMVLAQRFGDVLPEEIWVIYWPLVAAANATDTEAIFKSYMIWWFQITHTKIPG
jgi:hypothetical protein